MGNKGIKLLGCKMERWSRDISDYNGEFIKGILDQYELKRRRSLLPERIKYAG